MANAVKRPAKIHVRKGDTVVILSGRDSGQKGKISKVMPREGKVVVDGCNTVKRHMKARPPKYPQGGIIEKAMPIDSCKVMLVCPKCDKAVRVKKQLSDQPQVEGKYTPKYIRVCRKCGAKI